MKSLLIVLLVSLFFVSCNKKTDNKTGETDTKKDTSKQNAQTNTNSQNAAGDTTKQSTSLINIEYDISKLPPTLKDYTGDIVAMAKWEDKAGANVLFVTETKETTKGENRAKELYAYHYTITDKENKLIWKINDFIKDCPVDVTLSYIPKSISITDLNKNGIAESSFLYKMSCKGDVSEDDLKLIMHEGDAKYAIRGSMKLKMNGETYGGKTTVDASFDKAPKEFLEHAKGQWDKFQTETIETN